MFVWEKDDLAAGSSREGHNLFLGNFNDKPWGAGLGFRTGLPGLDALYCPGLPKLLRGTAGLVGGLLEGKTEPYGDSW